MTKTVQQLIDEYKSRKNSSIKSLVVDIKNGVHAWRDISNFTTYKLSDGTERIKFDTEESHYTVIGKILIKEEAHK